MAAAPTNYDPSVIQQFADRLYARAASIVLTCAVLGFLIGAAGGAAAGTAIGSAVVGAVLGGILIAALFAAAAQDKAFKLRLDAQTALCQAQIEMNTRQVAMRNGIAA